MDYKFIDEYQRQLSDWQSRFFETWMNVVPGKEKRIDLFDIFDKTINLQQEFVGANIKAQTAATQLFLEAQRKVIDTQQQYWSNYFDLMRRVPVARGEIEYRVGDKSSVRVETSAASH
jgi:hypothetical protein